MWGKNYVGNLNVYLLKWVWDIPHSRGFSFSSRLHGDIQRPHELYKMNTSSKSKIDDLCL